MQFNLVILDLSVRNGMGGLETLTALRAMDPTVTAVVTSGYANDEVLQQYASRGFKGALQKPFAMTALRTMISQVLTDCSG